MKEDISESLTFDDVSMLMNEKGSFTEKIISLAENSEYIKFLVDDLIDADSSYFKRLIRLVMSDYRVLQSLFTWIFYLFCSKPQW